MPRPRLAWFSPVPPTRSGIAAYTAELLPSLADQFAVDVFVDGPATPLDGARVVRPAHAFVPEQVLRPFDLVVYQLGNAACHDYMWPYLVRYPGLVVLHDAAVHHARARALLSRGRKDDYRAEFRYSHPDAPVDLAEFAVAGLTGSPYYLWPHVRVPLERARAVAVHAAPLAEALADARPSLVVRRIRMGVPALSAVPAPAVGGPGGGPVFACFGRITPEKRISQVLRAFSDAVTVAPDARLLLVGEVADYYDVAAEIADLGLSNRVALTGYVTDAELPSWIAAADVCLCLRWPTAGETSASWLRCLAAGRATVITDLVHTVDVPVLDPRSWTLCDRRRDAAAASGRPDPREAVSVAIDILDEDHSLGLALRRLAMDAALRDQLGRRALAWWETHHRLEHMTQDYRTAIADAIAAPVPTPAPDLPAHLLDVGAARLASVIRETGLAADPLGIVHPGRMP